MLKELWIYFKINMEASCLLTTIHKMLCNLSVEKSHWKSSPALDPPSYNTDYTTNICLKVQFWNDYCGETNLSNKIWGPFPLRHCLTSTVNLVKLHGWVIISLRRGTYYCCLWYGTVLNYLLNIIVIPIEQSLTQSWLEKSYIAVNHVNAETHSFTRCWD